MCMFIYAMLSFRCYTHFIGYHFIKRDTFEEENSLGLRIETVI